jgi:hypothetical protein
MSTFNTAVKPPTIQDLDAQIAELQGRMRNNNGAYNVASNPNDEISRLLAQRNGMVQADAAAQPQNPWNSVQGARDQTFGLATGRLNDLKGDPVDKLVMQELKNRISGKTNPYDATTKNAMLTQQAQMAAQVENNQLAQLSAHGGSVTDPSYQSALREAEAGRQASAQQANLDINSKANLANYDAKTNAVAGLGGFNQQRNAAITGQSNYLSGLYSQVYATHETPPSQPAASQAGPTWQEWAQYLSGQGGKATTPAPTAAAPTAAAPTAAAVNPYTGPLAPNTGTAQPAQPAHPGTSIQWSGIPYPSNSYSQQPINLGEQIVNQALWHPNYQQAPKPTPYAGPTGYNNF